LHLELGLKISLEILQLGHVLALPLVGLLVLDYLLVQRFVFLHLVVALATETRNFKVAFIYNEG